MGSSSDRKFVISMLVLVFCAIAYLGDIKTNNGDGQDSSLVVVGATTPVAIAPATGAIKQN